MIAMPAQQDIHVVWDEAAVKAWTEHSPQCQAALARLVAQITVTMKAAIPVSKVQTVYANPVVSGPGVTRHPGDLPLRPSGFLRSSVHALRVPGGDILIGPTAPYAAFVDQDTRPHIIRSHGTWPLRNRATGQVFGQVVHHPGTTGHHFIEKAAASVQGVRLHV